MIETKLKFYFYEANKHIEKINNSKKVLSNFYPFTVDTLEDMDEREKDKLDVLVFRFSKLQDLIGEKLFRNILNLMGFNTNRPFIEILAELEREGIVDIDKWIALRNIRNSIAHEYPYQEEILIEAINFILENSDYLIDIVNKIQRLYNETLEKRN